MMDYRITSTNIRYLKNGTVKGTIKVQEGKSKRKHTVQFDCNLEDGWEQWGAPTEVLCFTVPTMKRIHNELMEE